MPVNLWEQVPRLWRLLSVRSLLLGKAMFKGEQTDNGWIPRGQYTALLDLYFWHTWELSEVTH